MKKLSPAKRKRVEYFSITTAIFFSTAIFMGMLFSGMFKFFAAMAESPEMGTAEISLPPDGLIWAFSLIYGVILSMMIGAIILFARFMSDKPLGLKITAAILWPITYMCIAFVMYAVIPYWFYNTVKMFMREKQPEVLWSAENYSSLAEQKAMQPAAAQYAATQPAIAQPAAVIDPDSVALPAAESAEIITAPVADNAPAADTADIPAANTASDPDAVVTPADEQ